MLLHKNIIKIKDVMECVMVSTTLYLGLITAFIHRRERMVPKMANDWKKMANPMLSLSRKI